MPHPPAFGMLNHLQDRNLSGREHGIPLHGPDGHGHEGRGRPYGHDRVRGVHRHGSAHGDVRAGARGCVYSRHENVRGSAHDHGRERANACVRAFLP